MFEPKRHAPLRNIPWNAEVARTAISEIISDALSAFDGQRGWPVHPSDEVAAPQASVYLGGAGVAWALHYLSDVGAAGGTMIDFRPHALALLSASELEMQTFVMFGERCDEAGSLLLGDLGTALALMRLVPSPELADRIHARVIVNDSLPVRELMWGTPGSMLACIFMHDYTNEPRWRAAFERQARRVLSELEETPLGPVWTQDLYANRSQYLGPVHGYAGNMLPLLKGWSWLTSGQRAVVEAAVPATLAGQAFRQDGHASWSAEAGKLVAPDLCQYCHGAPGIVATFADAPFSTPALDDLLGAGGELVWAAGPLAKGSNLCHGTGGNGYAFLKLYRRTGNALWLDRARSFAMTAIAQCRETRARHGRGRFSLWTGDVGLAVYLWDCTRSEPAFPFIDVI